MIEEPVQNPSDNSMNLKALVDQIMSSSENRERCIISIDEAARNSSAKSRSETESSEFLVTCGKSSCAATYSLSIGKVVPASAPDPSGITLTRLRQSSMR